jgi:hypothetical protein
MTNKIEFENIGIAEVLQRYRLRVPLNQREYAWAQDNVRDLLLDVATAMRKHREVYFLGTIVLTTSENGLLEVSDGQQRLATTTMIFAAIRDFFIAMGDVKRADAIEQKFLFETDIETREKISKLSLNADDNEYFCSKILNRPDERNGQIVKSRKSHGLLDDAFKNIKEYFDGERKQVGEIGFADRLLEWRKFLLESANVISLRVPNAQDAFVMFETLNDRGLKTSQADLVKNYLFGESGARLNEAQTHWSSMRGAIESIGEDDLTMDYLRHACCLLYGHTRDREIFAKIQLATKGSSDSIHLLNRFSELANDYAAILNPDHPKWNSYDPNIRQAIKTLNLLNVSQIRPLMLGVAKYFAPQHATQSFGRFVSWSVRFMIVGGGGKGSLEKEYSELASAVGRQEIKTVTSLDAAIKIVPTDAIFQSSFETVRVKVPKIARYLLRSLESTAQNQPYPEWVVNEESRIINLEHVMPDTKCDTWTHVTDRDLETHANRLGNQVLLQSNVNSNIDRLPFDEKKKAFESSGFLLTSQLTEATQWGVSQIEQRQRTLADIAVRTWKIG